MSAARWLPAQSASKGLHALRSQVGTFNEASLLRFDLVLSEAAKNGIKVIFPFVNYWPYMGGMQWYVDQVRCFPSRITAYQRTRDSQGVVFAYLVGYAVVFAQGTFRDIWTKCSVSVQCMCLCLIAGNVLPDRAGHAA